MRYFRCKCGSHTFLSETQCSCCNCGRLIQIDDVHRSVDLLRSTGIPVNPVFKVAPYNDTKYDMNRWSELERKKYRKNQHIAS